MKVLITGHAGFIGAELARQLTAGGCEVRGFSRAQGDIRDAQAVCDAAAGCDVIVHAAYAPVRAPSREILDVAVNGMASVLRACEVHSVRGLVLVSSPLAAEVTGVFPQESAAYGAGKLAAEAMAAAWARAGIPARLSIARPFNIYGPCGGYDHVIPQFITRISRQAREQPDGVLKFVIRGSPETIRSFCYVTDCAAQLAGLAEGAMYGPPAAVLCDAGVSDKRTIGNVAHAIAACFDRKIEVIPAPGRGTPGHRVPASTQPPQVSFAVGLARTVAWYREREEAVASEARPA